MSSDFDSRLRAMAGVVVRVGLNLQPGQPLLITDPYELQGTHPEAAPLVAAVCNAVGTNASVLPADTASLRGLAEAGDTRGFETLVANHTARLRQHLARRGAFLFLTGSQPGLFAGLPAGRLGEFDRIKWRHLGPVIQQLIRGATQWTLVPAPTTPWADAAYADLPAAERLPALWRTVFDSFRLDADNPGAAWGLHLGALARRRDELNAARHHTIRYVGRDTDLRLGLPRFHRWCTAQLATTRGVPFVVNLPTEEIFTAPHRGSAEGRVRVARPVVHAGSVIDGITLEFVNGRVIAGHAATGHDLLQHLLRIDDGARRIGEVALVPGRNRLNLAGRLFHHTILDENACSHLALGDAYRFCSRAWIPLSLNSSQLHLDLPLDATVALS
jgi:aminopeptidase